MCPLKVDLDVARGSAGIACLPIHGQFFIKDNMDKQNTVYTVRTRAARKNVRNIVKNEVQRNVESCILQEKAITSLVLGLTMHKSTIKIMARPQ